jgi:beta-phosphoglucomutase family hydrolase
MEKKENSPRQLTPRVVLETDERLKLIEPQEPYSALIFDCDGTLIDTMPLHYQAWVKALSVRGVQFSEKQFYDFAGMPTVEILRIINEEYGCNLDIDATHEEKERIFVELAHQIAEVRAVANIAREHFGKVPMAVASGGIRSVVEQTLTTAGLRQLFEVVVTAEDVKHGKPAPDMFLLAAERMAVTAKDCVVYEDAEQGLEAARRAGMRAIDVRVLCQ